MQERQRVYKMIRAKLLNRKCNSLEEFEETQERLNEIELEINLLERRGR